MDEKQHQLIKELEMREALLAAKQCLGCMHEGVLVTTLDGTIVETTPAAEHILETPSLVMKGRNIHDYCLPGNVYDDMLQQVTNDARALNRSLVVTSGTGMRK